MADDKDAEFAFDLFSDIAPLLALFGDQFARQFTSESLTWVDHLILAMVPLGILTVITGAIRVQGPRIAKSFIGRGRENRALAEIELMSSTSGEVCELFNGKSIIRVMGKPQIAQILVYPELYGSLKLQNEEMDRIIPDADAPKQADQDVSCGIHSFKTAALDEDAGRRLLSYQRFEPKSYGYPCYIAGSVLLSLGIAVCSLAVERNTVEYDWKVLTKRKAGDESAPGNSSVSMAQARKATSPRLLWLQQSQEVNDQAFDGYAILAGPKHHVITSSRIEDTEKHLNKKQPGNTDLHGHSKDKDTTTEKEVNDLNKPVSILSQDPCLSIYTLEKFMDEFLPKRLDSFIWVVEAVGTKPSNGGNERSDYVNVPMRRSSKGKWQVDIGRIDAILSLWMASIESYTAATQVSKQRKSKGQIVGEDTQSNRALPDWRRSKAGVDMRYNYCRILGDDFEDGVLKRDIAWWVDELTAEQSDVRAKRKLDRSDEVPLDGLGTTMPTSHHKSETADTWECSNARAKAKSTDLVIGFNGREVDSKRSLAGERPRELAITSTGLLPTILAQHLFTSFMWTVVEQLPEDCLRQGVLSSEQDVEIDARHTFDPHEFVDTWRRPTLRHRQLTKLVRQLETFGLGTQNEVLLCMVPALSSRDLLPNHVILKLIPQIRHGQGWAETARCYNRLLEQSMRVAPRANMSVEKFCYNVVVATIDFLCFASEPYDEHISAPDELSTELEDIVARLVSARFATVVTKLAQAYILQRRNHDVERVLKLFGTPESFRRLDENEQLAVPFGGGEKLEACLEVYKLSKTRLDFMFLEKTLGLSRSLRPIYEALSGMPQSESTDQPPMPQFYSSAAKTHDIFDWTPLHYASFLEDRSLLWRYFEPKQVRKHLSIHKTLGPFGRTPVHMAAISGSRAAMQWISKCLANTEDKKNAFEMVGLDGMSPLHLATKTGNHYMIEKMVRKRRIRATTSIDFWRRAAIHLAASHGHHGIATILLKDAQLDAVDDIGKTPLEYLLKNRGELQDTEEPKTDTTATLDDGKTAEDGLDGLGDGKDAVQGVADALHDKRDVTLEMISAEQSEPPEADTDIRSEQNLDDETSEVSSIKKREAAEQKRKIFLEFASRRSEYRDEKGRTFLYHAIEYTDVNTIEQLLSTGYKLEFRDTNGYTPLHFALWTDRPKVAIRLLQGLASQTADPSVKDEQGCTALMFAAMSGHINVVRFLVERESSSRQEAPATTEDTSTILEKWPRDINQPDSIYGQTPLSFACELGSSSVVDMLLAYDTLDINKPAKDWGDYTPLQAAVMNERASIVKKLLCQKSIDVNAKNSYGQTAVDMAGSNAEVAQVLLTHEQVDSKTRLSFMSQCCRSANQAVQEILPDILTLVSDGDITDKELIDLVYTSEESRSIVPHAAFVRRAFGRDTWKSIVHPYHKVARIGSLELADVLKEYGSDPTDLDDDGWSCIEYAETYQGSSLDAGLLRALQTAAAKPGDISKIKPPAALRYTHVESCVSLNSCKEAGHKDCDGIHALQVTEAYESTRVNIRTTTCVPPLSEHVKSFYFEVTILKESDSRLFGVGFCDKNYYDNQMPGWYDMSFAYHGDDGGLFISVGFGRNPTTDFGTRGTYGVGDTVGAGLNLETGEGFFTLNGKRKDAGDAFADVKFKGRKLYPCVGYDGTEDGIGLRFETNLGLALKAHPFKYKGFTSRYGSGMDDEELDKVAKGAIL
ncbi:hypothetical protein N0V91_008208 [Didymella pomorum]|uniref:B30.2/SPRY domain-containing protein n=1 Tax=Didymella pomorum TaxID=749634 RepID=A0A9W9D5N3_9PLEO|nr:hypothetical protein N0V91_008208 [Didymella pomorum]